MNKHFFKGKTAPCHLMLYKLEGFDDITLFSSSIRFYQDKTALYQDKTNSWNLNPALSDLFLGKLLCT